jgi:F-type H+-transporting ATPase subunit delta
VTGAPRTLARRYARALLDVADRQGPNAALALRDELRAFAPIVTGHPELQRALVHPGVGIEAKKGLLVAVARRAGASALLQRLLVVLAERDRVALLEDVVEAYAGQVNAAQGIVSAEAVSAVALPDAQRRALAAVLGDAVELRTRVEPQVLGGLLVRVGGRTYDGTVRARLDGLRRRLAAPAPGPSARAS